VLGRFFRLFSGIVPVENEAIYNTPKADNGAGVDILIDLAGRVSKNGKRNLAVAVSKLGYIHICTAGHEPNAAAATDRTVIVRLQPQLSSELAVVAACYQIADLQPARTVVIVDSANPVCCVSSGYMPALRKIAALVRNRGQGEMPSAGIPVRPI
jgi:hypothetical protein